MGSAFFSTFLSIPIPALKIRKATAHLIPLKAKATNLFFINSSKKREIIKIIIIEGKTTPKVAKVEPKTPFFLNPTKVAIFIATGPGVDSQTPIKS